MKDKTMKDLNGIVTDASAKEREQNRRRDIQARALLSYVRDGSAVIRRVMIGKEPREMVVKR